MDSPFDAVTVKALNDSDNIPSVASARRNDPALKHLLHWIARGTPPSSQKFKGLPRTTWNSAHEFRSLKVVKDILCREFIHKGGSSHHQQLIPASLVHENLKSIHSSPTGGNLGIFKTVEKVRERFYWPGFQEDIKFFINRCEQCRKRVNPPKTHRCSLVEWTPIYPFHHIGINFMGPWPLSISNQHFLLIGDQFSKWYKAIPLPEQTAPTTATALLENWICRFGYPHRIHTDQGRNFESKLSRALNQALQVDKTRTTAPVKCSCGTDEHYATIDARQMHQWGTEQLVATAPGSHDGISHFSTRFHGLHAIFSRLWTGSVPPHWFHVPKPNCSTSSRHPRVRVSPENRVSKVIRFGLNGPQFQSKTPQRSV